jgi:hypothetical protein
MALYHFVSKIIQRSKGRSIVAAAAYRSGMKIKSEYDGLIHNYERKSGIMRSEILLPQDAPTWMGDRAKLWNSVEFSEKRRDAQLAREIEFSLPIELDQKTGQAIAREFILSEFVDRGMIADFNFHDVDGKNPHVHVLLSLREVNESGFGKKNRDWNKKDLHSNWRKKWEEKLNAALERAGIEERVSCESYEARGIDQEPQIHVGVHATAMERRGIETERGSINRAIIVRNTLKEITKLESQKVSLVQQPLLDDLSTSENIKDDLPNPQDEYLTQVRRELKAKLERKAREEAARDARIAAAEKRDASVKVEAKRILQENRQAYNAAVDALAERDAHLKKEPSRPLILGLNEWKKARAAWEKMLEMLQKTLETLWTLAGGNFDKHDNYGRAEMERRITPGFAEKVAEKLVDNRQPSGKVVKTKKQDVTPEPQAHIGESVLAVGDWVLYKLIGGTSQIKGQITKVGDAENTVTIRVSGGKDYKLSLSKGTVEKLALDQTQVTGRKKQKRDLDLGR